MKLKKNRKKKILQNIRHTQKIGFHINSGLKQEIGKTDFKMHYYREKV